MFSDMSINEYNIWYVQTALFSNYLPYKNYHDKLIKISIKFAILIINCICPI